MRININDTMVKAMAEILQPQMQGLASTAMDALVSEVKKTSDDPLAHAVIDITAGWVKEQGVQAAKPLVERLHAALSGDGAGLATLAPDLSAADLTRLADAYQTAEAGSRHAAQRAMQRLGSVLGDFGRYAGRAFIIALVA